MTSVARKLRAVWSLGPLNVARVAGYRYGLRTGLHPVRRIPAVAAPRGPFFAESKLPPIEWADAGHWRNDALIFGRHRVTMQHGAPDWHRDQVSGRALDDPGRDWWRIPDFGAVDIKSIWELSRFDWVLAFAQRARNGEAASLERLNAWLDDWSLNNPPYRGPNWKCGQESSLRVLHLAAAALILGQERSTLPALLDLVEAHLARIAPTVSYARAQDNNHATSEAAALFVGGSWLAQHGRAGGRGHCEDGRSQLEEHVRRLFETDGTFSQYSVNYHRVALDTLSLVEVWRRRLDLAAFGATFAGRARAATEWLHAFTDPANGDAPVLGANDGARLLQLTPTDYRDYRPSVQLASTLFLGKAAYPSGPHDGALAWLALEPPGETLDAPASRVFERGGYAVLRRGEARAFLRFPRHRFRPGQADALHTDLWLGERNVLRDGGTFSYCDPNGLTEALMGTAAHNTVQFDGVDQMPQVSRFLHADWLRAEQLEPLGEAAAGTRFGAVYRNRLGHRHARTLELADGSLAVRDEVSGFESKAVLRWRLQPGDWKLDSLQATADGLSIKVESDQPVTRVEIVAGVESRYYHELAEVPVLEVEIGQPGTFTTTVRWTA